VQSAGCKAENSLTNALARLLHEVAKNNQLRGNPLHYAPTLRLLTGHPTPLYVRSRVIQPHSTCDHASPQTHRVPIASQRLTIAVSLG
jgi:hypothetical protein